MNCFRDVTTLYYHVPMTTVGKIADTVLDGHWKMLAFSNNKELSYIYTV